jgi:hypothetical protein
MLKGLLESRVGGKRRIQFAPARSCPQVSFELPQACRTEHMFGSIDLGRLHPHEMTAARERLAQGTNGQGRNMDDTAIQPTPQALA